MALPRVLPHALDGASLGSISAPPQHAHRCPDPVRDHPIAPPHAAICGKRIHTARARRQARGRNGRPDDRTLSRPRPSLMPGGQCDARKGRMHAVLFREFLRVPPPKSAGAPLHVCSCQICASAFAVRALDVCVGSSMCRSHARQEGGCAQTAPRVCSLLLRYQDYTLHYLSHPY
jgi:hypothetical protein